jgi:endoglycosylceramidase
MQLKSLVVAALVGAAAGAEYTIDKATRTFRDSAGRARIFHGQNVVVKLPNYLPTDGEFNYEMSMNDQDLEYLKSWGTKIIRLGVMWESVETAPGEYDMVYLDAVENLINRFGDYGMAVIVDNHQDLFSRTLCGEGVPWFYTPKDLDHRCPTSLVGIAFHLAGECVSLNSYGMSLDSNGNPLIEDCKQHDFLKMYTAPEVASAFDGLYKNKDGLLDKMMDFWTVVSARFAANDNVIGYDILNEPWAANLYYEPSLLLHPTSFDADILFPIAQRADQTVRL